MVAIHFLIELLAGQNDLVSIHDDNIVAGVNMGSEGGLVLAAQDHGDLRCQTSEHHTFCIDNVPSTLDLGRLGHIRIHG